jgi:light-regulated signal transduction histidine kinase (bacteriophytochrome)
MSINESVADAGPARCSSVRSRENGQRFADLTYAILHDVEAPVRQIAAFSQLLEQCAAFPDGGQEAHYLGRVLTAAAKIDDLFGGLARYVAAVRTENDGGPTDPAAAAVEAARLADPTGRLADDLGLAPLPMVVVGSDVLVVALFEIFDNIVKHGPIEPRARLTAEARGDTLRLIVTDNGAGFGVANPAMALRLFKRIGQTDVPGTGVGLSIVEALMFDAGGRVDVLDTTDGGAQVVLTCPAVSVSLPSLAS